jgi:N-acetylneuraminic acid mutarotase
MMAGDLYATGGWNGGDNNRLRSAEKYLPLSDTWSAVAALPEVRTNHAAVAVGLAMYLVGGVVGNDSHRNRKSSVIMFDGNRGTWSEVAPMPEPRICVTACSLGSIIYVFGGRDLDEDQASVCKYNAVANEWSTLAPMPIASSNLSACVVGGIIYIIGASNCDVLRFDPVSEVWSTVARTLHSRKSGSCFALGGFMYAVSGMVEASAERYDISTDTWTAVTDMLEGRISFCAIATGSVGPAEELNLFDSLIAQASTRHL